MSNRKIVWGTVYFNIREATEELDRLFRDLRAAKEKDFDEKSCARNNLCEGRLAVALFHAYHHLNSSWGARFRPMPDADRTFHANEKWPAAEEFKPLWPRKAWARMKKGGKHDLLA